MLNATRRLIALGAIVALASCSGGGGSSSLPGAPGSGGGVTPTASPHATATPTGGAAPALASPHFHLTIPRRTSRKKGSKTPAFISSAIQSIKIQLTADSAGIDPATLDNNPAITNADNTTCGSGCDVVGPPSPLGSDTYTITTYDVQNAGGDALDTAVDQVFTINEGVANDESVTLNGIPAYIDLPDGGVYAFPAGSTNYALMGGASADVEIDVQDADRETITGTYATPVTLDDPDTNGDGTSVLAGNCPSFYPDNNPVVASTSAQLASSDDSVEFCYGGLAENTVTLTASTGSVMATADVETENAAPAYLAGSGSPSSVVAVNAGIADVQLYAAMGLGSTATVTYTEPGWTEAPYNQTLSVVTSATCSIGGPLFSSFGTAVPAYDATGTIFTVTAIGSPTPGACPLYVTDGLGDSVFSSPTELDASYTTSTLGVNSTHKH